MNHSRYMAATIRFARRHEGWTATNPSVACLIVKEGVIVGRGVTAAGGRPHAEPLALAEAGEAARGATAYVTLEPCAHHGRTPPCAQTLINAGVARVVTAIVDPDPRVDEKGHAMLRGADIEVVRGIGDAAAREGLAAYLVHKRLSRPLVTLKLAVSADGLIGRKGRGQVAITGPQARAQSHLMRARHHAIMVGAGTVLADDPELTCRLPGLETHSPARIVLDAGGRISPDARIVETAHATPAWIVAQPDHPHRAGLLAAGCELLPCEVEAGRVALPELLDDLGARGVQSLLVEGGATVAHSFLEEGLVDRIALFSSPHAIGEGDGQGIASPVTAAGPTKGFELTGAWQFGDDRLQTFARTA
jgi:diaminohydroxyphosphoribosylaminopyrimidine deaminase/5-amino-6-(5-phosphoribosylamino)uracil reductase